ncbi:MAG: TonB-dependent receptor [Tannerella sp.]|jgi:TonB-linked SusC/RagA family outer membrane protein|nr:TonB-dependent receptor [Tannerella sp.]
MKKSIFILLLFGCFALSAQQQDAKTFTMEGIVLDETGETMISATVYLKDKPGIGTVTDMDGRFSIKAVRGDVIVASYIGYQKSEFLVTEEKKNIEFNLALSGQLDEVVVVGLGSQRKISALSAVTTVDVKDLQTPVSSVTSLLGGRVAGVISMQTSGEPGKNLAEFWVRGIGTFGASSGALVLIDGLEGDLNAIDAADIETFSVLKDASATAVYGVRGANGVVLVTTKKGEEGKMQITARANFSISQLRRLPNYLRAYDYAKLANEARVVRGDDALYTPIDLDIIKDGLDPDMYPDVSWQDEILKPVSFRQSYYASARGGGNIARYFISLGVGTEDAAYRQDKSSPYSSNVGYDTYSFRTNLDINLTKSTTMYFGADGFLAIRTEPGIANTDYLWDAQANITPLLFPTIYSTGQLPATGSNDQISPYVLINHTGQSSNEDYQGKMTLALNQNLDALLEGLKFKIQGAYDIQSSFNELRYTQPALYHAIARNANGRLVMQEMLQASAVTYGSSMDRYRKYHLEMNLNYDKVINTDHRVSGLVYYYISDQKRVSDANSSLSAIPVRYQGVSSRLTYGFRDTYLVDFNFGYTGSENFMPGKQYGFFPSISLGWIPTNYQWMTDNLPLLNFFKIRGSYGSVGNDRLAGTNRFPYLTLISTGTGSIWGGNTTETVNENVIGADNLAWEKAIKADLGLEGKLWDNKISFVVDFFNDQRDGIFQPRIQVPDYVGLISMPYGNVGKMKSYGSDGNISYSQEINKDMFFTLRGNFTYSKNMVQNWEQVYQRYPYLENTGFPNGVIRGYKALGLFKDEDDIKYSPIQTFGGSVMPGDIKYMDINGDGKINSDDRVPLSYSTYPKLMYGFGGEFAYKKISIGVLFKGTGKTDYFHIAQGYDAGYDPFNMGERGNVLSIVADPHNRWIPRDYAIANGIDPALAENPNARFPRLQYNYNINDMQLSDFWQGDARYLRLQEVTLNYNLKHNYLQKMGVSSIDLQLVGSNLYVWDKVKLFDPEQASRNGRVYPLPSIYSLQLYIHL